MSSKIFRGKTSLFRARKPITLGAILAILTSFSANDALAVLIEFDPSPQTVVLGDQATVDVLVNPMGSFVGTFDFIVGWDDAILDLASVTVDPADDLGFTFDIVDSLGATDSINVVSLSLEFDLTPFQDGLSTVNLFRLTFDTLAPGTSALTFSAGGFLGDEFGFALQADVSGGGVTVAAVQVPEPSTLMLTGMALAGLGWIGRRRRKT